MKKYLLTGLLFSLPLIVYFSFLLLIDPHNFANVFHVISDSDKLKIIGRNDESSPRGNMLWKALEIKRNKIKSVIIGDSQGAHINMDLAEQCSGEKIYNFCVPGASFDSFFKIFWFVADHQPDLESVYFQVGFMNYNSYREYCIFKFAQDYFDKPYLYFITKENLNDALANVKYQITKDPSILQYSYEFQTIEEINKIAIHRLDLFFGDYTYPDHFFGEFVKIKEYCEQKNIKIRFVILPNYKDVDKYLAENNLSGMMQRFKDDFNKLGNTIDLDVPCEIKNTREAYIDFFHIRQPYLDQLTKQIWGNPELKVN